MVTVASLALDWALAKVLILSKSPLTLPHWLYYRNATSTLHVGGEGVCHCLVGIESLHFLRLLQYHPAQWRENWGTLLHAVEGGNLGFSTQLLLA